MPVNEGLAEAAQMLIASRSAVLLGDHLLLLWKKNHRQECPDHDCRNCSFVRQLETGVSPSWPAFVARRI